jgi:hypothetical protein
MTKRNQRTLVAVWLKIDGDDFMDAPDIVRWGDGSAAAKQEYFDHCLDTHRILDEPEGGLTMVIYLDVVADVKYDPVAKVWGASGGEVEEVSLGLTDPDATDGQIISALHTFRIVYRAEIHR